MTLQGRTRADRTDLFSERMCRVFRTAVVVTHLPFGIGRFTATSVGLLTALLLAVSLASASVASADLMAFETGGSWWVANAATGENQVKVPGTEQAGGFVLSPSGAQGAYEVRNETAGITELYVVNIDGSEKRLVADLEYGTPLRWSPDGGSLVYEGGQVEKIYVLNVATGKRRLLGGTGKQIDPCWSRDGNYIAFDVAHLGEETGGVQLDVMNADGTGSPRAVLENEHPEGSETELRTYTACSFGPRDELAFMTTARVTETDQVFTVNFDGSKLTQLTFDTESPIKGPRVSGPVWNKQGTRIAYQEFPSYPEANEGCSNIATINPSGGEKSFLLKRNLPTPCYSGPSFEEPYLFLVPEPASEELLGPENPGEPQYNRACAGKPVNCATGNESVSQTDLSAAGRGVGLNLARTYNAQAAVNQGTPGSFGYGWSASYSDHLVLNSTEKRIEVVQANGSGVTFTGTLGVVGEKLVAPEWVQATLAFNSEHIYVYTLPNQEVFKFNETGRLLSEADRNGNTTSLSYTETGRLEAATDPAGRKLTFAYNPEGFVESVKDPMGHTVKYVYEGGNLVSVTEPGETAPRWRFEYDASHRLIKMTDGRGGTTTNEYDSSNRVISQTDPSNRVLSFEYGTNTTTITNKTTGSVTKEIFTAGHEPESVTRGYGTSSATTETSAYNEWGEVRTATDGDGHTTEYHYDPAGNRTTMIDPNKNETKWTYNSTHDVLTTTTPKGETTTIKRDSHGNAETVSRPAPGSTTQITTYKYDSQGNVESMEDALKRVWKYEYDSYGDRTAETDPEGDKRTWGYNEDSQETSTVSPRGNVTGGEPAKYTTSVERDAQGRPLKITDPPGHATKYSYDADGNIETRTDANSHTTTYTYDADNEQTKIKEPNGTVIETGYDGAGRITSQTDGNKHETKYVRNILEQVTEAIDPLGRKTTKEYDKVGNLKKLTDAATRTTTYTYDPANRLTEVTYSDGKTHLVKYGYDADGDRTSMIDGTGTTSYTYDQLDRLTESKDGHGDKTSYEYDLANQQTKITYPNGKAVTQTYDKAGRLEKITDWLEHTTKFAYDPNSNLTTTTFPTGTNNVDKYTYNEADQMSETKMTKSAETLASLIYARDNDGQVKTITSKGLPGEEKPGYEYDTNNRLTKAATNTYEYDSADNPTKIPGSTNTYDNADQLKTGTSLTYTYDELGERTKRTPTSGSATTYAYDQAGNPISITRPKEGLIAELKDTYTYDGNGLRASQTISGTASFLTWNPTGGLPLLLNDTTNSYIYGPGGLPVEQISSSGTVTYLHHDQQGSIRLLTGATGTVTGSTTFDAYGNKTGSTGTGTTPLGYDAQYTSSDTGLIYLQARTYDPATAQFLSVDPIAPITRAPYTYAEDNPLNLGDPTGLWSPTEGIERLSNEIGESIANVGGGLVNGATGGLIEGSGNSCSTGYEIGQYGSLFGAFLLPEDLGPQLFQKFANRFPKAAALLLNQQAKQQVSQPGKLFIVKSVVEKLLHLFGG